MPTLIETIYKRKVEESSDINEHLPTLYKYGLECKTITECGVRSVVSSYAFAAALLGRPNTKLFQIDIVKSDRVEDFQQECEQYGIDTVFYEQSDLLCPLEETDLLFIDTWHIYGHLKRELARWNSVVTKFIILHDTTVDEWDGESVRCGWDIPQQSIQSGIPEEEISKGLWPAIEEFLADHLEWRLKERFTNNNGLTILERVS